LKPRRTPAQFPELHRLHHGDSVAVLTLRDALHDGFHRALHDPDHLETLECLDMPIEYLRPADYAGSVQEIIVLEKQRMVVSPGVV